MFTEDLSVFFNTSEFAQPATIGGADYNVIFDKAYTGALAGLVESTGPQMLIATVDATAAALTHGTVVVIAGTSYTVAGVEPDGTGATVVQLRA